MDFDEFDEAFDAEVGEGQDLLVVEAIDPDHAILRFHFIGDVMEEVDAFAELFSDAIDGRDVRDLVYVHVQAASDEARADVLAPRHNRRPRRSPPISASGLRFSIGAAFAARDQCYPTHAVQLASLIKPTYLPSILKRRPTAQGYLKNKAGDGPIKAFTLRGIKDRPPYFHDGRF